MKTQPPREPQHTAPNLSEIIHRAPGDLRPWPTNPRTHSAKQLFKLKKSFETFGFTAPVLVDESSVILSGHGRVQAALELGLASIPTRVIEGLTSAKKRAYVIADNKIAQLAEWDSGLLKSELEVLIQADFELELTGFSTAEIDIMFEGAETPAGDPEDLRPEDIAPEVVSRPGDLFRLGNHLVFCGDALDESSYRQVMDGALAQMCFTDPPYNVPIDGHVCGNGKVKHRPFIAAVGELTPSQFTAFLQAAFSQMHAVSAEGAVTFTCMDWRHTQEVLAAAQPLYGAPRQLCVWAKDNAGMGTFYRSQHELVHVFKKGEAPHINNFELGQHGRYRTNVWNYPGVNTFTGKGYELLALHPTVKPVGLVADAIRDCSHRKGLILDPFAGSGTILIAAERTGRHARAIELDPQYVDVAVLRWQRVTGGSAVLAATGQSWNELRAQRHAPQPTNA